jgi:hypothetical protein
VGVDVYQMRKNSVTDALSDGKNPQFTITISSSSSAAATVAAVRRPIKIRSQGVTRWAK